MHALGFNLYPNAFDDWLLFSISWSFEWKFKQEFFYLTFQIFEITISGILHRRLLQI
jgi:hypothetical protein